MRVIDCEYDVYSEPISVTCEDYGEIYEFSNRVHERWVSIADDESNNLRHGKEYLCVCTLKTHPQYRWISVLLYHRDGGNGFVDRPHFTDEGMQGMVVTHWMPLPELPKGEKT